MPKVHLSTMPTVRLSFVVDQDQLGAVLGALRPYARGPMTIDDTGEVEWRDIGPVISARKAAAVFRGERPSATEPVFERQILGEKPNKPERRKVRKTARRLKIKAKAKANGAAGRERNPPGKVQAAIVDIIRDAGAEGIEPAELHNQMVREGFALQTSYNGLFVAKKKKAVKFQGNKLVVAE